MLIELLQLATLAYILCPAFIFSPSCVCCLNDCRRCSGDKAAASYQVDISGMVDDLCAGTGFQDCTDWNSSFLFDIYGGDSGTPPNDICLWLFTLSFAFCQNPAFPLTSEATLQFAFGPAGLQVETFHDFRGDVNVWNDSTWNDDDACYDFDERNVPYLSQSGTAECDASSSTCKITSFRAR